MREAGSDRAATTAVKPTVKGAEASPDLKNIRSGETYLGYERATNFASRENLRADTGVAYSISRPGLNEWGLSGSWTVGAEQAKLDQKGGSIVYRFSARDLHLVLGPDASEKAVRFQVTIDGQAPGVDHGADTNADGNGVVTSTRLYQLVRQPGQVEPASSKSVSSMPVLKPMPLPLAEASGVVKHRKKNVIVDAGGHCAGRTCTGQTATACAPRRRHCTILYKTARMRTYSGYLGRQ